MTAAKCELVHDQSQEYKMLSLGYLIATAKSKEICMYKKKNLRFRNLKNYTELHICIIMEKMYA